MAAAPLTAPAALAAATKSAEKTLFDPGRLVLDTASKPSRTMIRTGLPSAKWRNRYENVITPAREIDLIRWREMQKFVHPPMVAQPGGLRPIYKPGRTTLLELAERDRGRVHKLSDVLNQTNEILRDLPWSGDRSTVFQAHWDEEPPNSECIERSIEEGEGELDRAVDLMEYEMDVLEGLICDEEEKE